MNDSDLPLKITSCANQEVVQTHTCMEQPALIRPRISKLTQKLVALAPVPARPHVPQCYINKQKTLTSGETLHYSPAKGGRDLELVVRKVTT